MFKKLRVRKSLIVVGILVGCVSLVNLPMVACQTNKVDTAGSWVHQAGRPLGARILECKNPVNGKCQCPETQAAQGSSSKIIHQSSSLSTMEQIAAHFAQARVDLEALERKIEREIEIKLERELKREFDEFQR